MPICRECQWFTPHDVDPRKGRCRVKIEESRYEGKLVNPEDDASKCPNYGPRKEKYRYVEI